MKTSNRIKHRRAMFSLAGAAVLAGAGTATADQFLLRILDHHGSTLIPGESAVQGHEGWIDVFSFGSSVEHKRNEDGSARSGEVTHNDFTFHKLVDKSTPRLQEACFSGLLLPAVQIKHNGGFDGTGTAINSPLSVSLNHVQVVAYKTFGRGESAPREEVSLAYSEVEWTYLQQDAQGNDVDEVNATLIAFLGTNDPAFDDDNDGLTNDLDNDDDNDGIDDETEVRGGTNPYLDDADQDLDGDGQNNRDESIAGTDMNDASNYFGIESIRRTRTPNGLQMTVSFPVAGGRHYRLLASPDPSLPSALWIMLDEFHHPLGNPDEGADIVLNPALLNNAANLFFRIDVRLESEGIDPTPVDPIDPAPVDPIGPPLPPNGPL